MKHAIAPTAQIESQARDIRRNRSNVLSYLLKLNKCLDANHPDLAQAVATRFSESLIDYISFAHFRLYETCPPEPHHLPAISNTTRLALRFDDQYAHTSNISLGRIKAALEQLALAMEVQFEIEDELLAR